MSAFTELRKELQVLKVQQKEDRKEWAARMVRFRAVVENEQALHLVIGDLREHARSGQAQYSALMSERETLRAALLVTETRATKLATRLVLFQAMARDCARDIERDYPGWARSWREVAP